MFALSTGEPAKEIELRQVASDQHVKLALKRIEDATFTGKGDRQMVMQLYKDYIDLLASVLTKTLAKQRRQSMVGGACETRSRPTLPGQSEHCKRDPFMKQP